MLASAGDTIKVWHDESFELVKEYQAHEGFVSDIAWNSTSESVGLVSTWS